VPKKGAVPGEPVVGLKEGGKEASKETPKEDVTSVSKEGSKGESKGESKEGSKGESKEGTRTERDLAQTKGDLARVEDRAEVEARNA